MRLICVVSISILFSNIVSAQLLKEVSPVKSSPLMPLAYEPLPVGTIKPSGWLKEQLQTQADGLSGHLDEFWPDIKDSGWIGGKAEGWERVPYWLDGLVPLAYQLEEDALKAKVFKYIDYSLTHQQEDGWIGPQQSSSPSGTYQPRDPWPVFVMLKVYSQYYSATGDKRIIPAMQRFLKVLDKQLDERPLFEWNKTRWQDLVLSIHWLYEQTGEAWLLSLADKAHRQGYDWIHHFNEMPIKERATRWTQEGHVVNNAMGIKTPAVWYRQSHNEADRATVRTAIGALDQYHGTASGVFTGDECLAGKMPSQGTETCAVVEYLYSLETAFAALGDPVLGDRLEQIAYNALPAPFSDDMWTHQYDHQANQVVCKLSEERVYTTNGPDANLFGLEPNYGCCTANLHQGWPKFVSHLWMKSPGSENSPAGGLTAVAYAPCHFTTQINDTEVNVVVDTQYPFEDTVKIRISTDKPVSFPLHLRIPAWAKKPTVKLGKQRAHSVTAGSMHMVSQTWENNSELVLHFPMALRTERRTNGALSIARGPLVYSLKIGTEWRYLRGEHPHADWEIFPTTPWNYALLVNEHNPDASIRFKQGKMGRLPFSQQGVPVSLTVKGALVKDWKEEKNAAAILPRSPVLRESPLEELILVPYGSAKLRVTEFPRLKTE